MENIELIYSLAKRLERFGEESGISEELLDAIWLAIIGVLRDWHERPYIKVTEYH